MKKTVLVILMLAAAYIPAVAEDLILKDDLLTLDRAVSIALKQHPSVLAGQGAVDVTRAKKGQAEAGYWPALDATAGYSRVKSSSSSSLIQGSSGYSPSHSFEQYSSGATVKQTLFDFGKTGSNVNIQKQNIEASKTDLENTEEQVILNVKQAYYNLLRAKRNRIVAAETVKQFEQHLDQAKAFYEVGTKPKFDVTKAEVDLSAARLSLIKADNAVRIAVVSLNNAMGLPEAPEYLIEDNLSFEKYDVTMEDAVKNALANRPELKSIMARKKASEESVVFARKGYFPMLTGNASWSWSGERFDVKDGGWNAGMTLSIPIFSGFLTKYQVSEAKANLNILNANEEALRQNILFEVQQNYLNLKEAEERIATAELTERQAVENYEIASGRYAAGVGNPIEVTDAEVTLSNARTNHIQALYDYKAGRAILEKAMGVGK